MWVQNKLPGPSPGKVVAVPVDVNIFNFALTVEMAIFGQVEFFILLPDFNTSYLVCVFSYLLC